MRPIALPLTLVLALGLAVPAAAQPPKAGAAGGATAGDRAEKGVRFRLPAGFTVTDHVESEPGGDEDTVHVARRGTTEVRVEVEDGLLDCTELPGGAVRRTSTAAGRDACESEAVAPPALGAKVVERRGALVAVQFGARHLSVLVFAPDAAAALKLARQVAATGEEQREPAAAP
jgi:hypothetical protein